MFIKHTWLAITWAGVIFVLCMLPGNDLPDLSFWELFTFDKFSHTFVFAILILLLITGFKKQYQYKRIKYNAEKIAISSSAFYGGLIELLQGSIFEGRSPELLDFVANCIGVVFGYLLFYLVYQYEPSKSKKDKHNQKREIVYGTRYL